MPISEIPILAMLRTRMQWHQERQRVLSENVANSDTPGFRPHDLAPPDFTRQSATGALPLARTAAAHLVASSSGAGGQFQADRKGPFEVRPAGNAVNVEDEMMKVAGNQMDYEAVTQLYARSLGLIKTALGR